MKLQSLFDVKNRERLDKNKRQKYIHIKCIENEKRIKKDYERRKNYKSILLKNDQTEYIIENNKLLKGICGGQFKD